MRLVSRVVPSLLRHTSTPLLRHSRASTHRACHVSPPMPPLKQQIALTETEAKVFEIFRQTTRHYDLDVTVRCAGGWVRDKLLGRHSDDIDIALDTMLGAQFAQHVNGFLESQGEEVHPVAVIETNPEQSKHLETARIKICGIQLDLVNLRSETYTQHSRVPQMNFGTPAEDAYRRDLTINAMFYNINASKIEDFTECGLEDLEKGQIRTPLPPLETFLDDPLRVLRAIRFAARFSFEMDPLLLRAAASATVREALRQKVSRERIGAEIDGMFQGPDPVMAVRHLVDLSLFGIVFLLRENLDVPQYAAHCLATLTPAFQLLQSLDPPFGAEARRVYLLAALLVPIQLMKGPHATGKGKRQFSPASAHVIWEGLKWRKKDAQDVIQLHEEVPNLINLYTRQKASLRGNGAECVELRVELGLWMRRMKGLWRMGVMLAPVFAMKEALPLEIEPGDYVLTDFVERFERSAAEAAVPLTLDTLRRQLCKEIEELIVQYGLEDAAELKPLLDGRTLMQEMGMTGGGPRLGELLARALRWQLAHPEGTKEQCLAVLKDTSPQEQSTL